MRANQWSPNIVLKFLLSLLLFSSVAQVYGRALPTRQSSEAAGDGDHIPPALNPSDPPGDRSRHHPVWNSSIVPGDKDRVPPAWNSSIVPGDKGSVPPAWNSSNVPGESGPWHHPGSGNGADHRHAATPGHIGPDNTTTLEKRARNICCFSVPIPSWCLGCGDDSSPEPEPAPLDPRAATSYPSMAEIVQKVQAYRTANWVDKTAIFYSNLAGASAISQALAWCNCHTDQVPVDPGRVYFNTAFDRQDLETYATRFSGSDQINNLLPKLFSQAYAEVATGDIYFFTPSDSEPGSNLVNPADIPRTVTWVGWEYPALTRNTGVTHIYRVDPRAGFNNDRQLIWSQGDPSSAQEPNGFMPNAEF